MWFGEMGVFGNWRTVKKRTLVVTDRIVVEGDSLSPMTFVRFKVLKRGVLWELRTIKLYPLKNNYKFIEVENVFLEFYGYLTFLSKLTLAS